MEVEYNTTDTNDPSINLIYDVISCLKENHPHYANKLSIIAGKDIVERYYLEKYRKEDHTCSNLIHLVDDILSVLNSEFSLSITNDDIFQLLKCIVTCEGKFSVMDRLNCYFWFLLHMNISKDQREFIRQCQKDMDSSEFIQHVQEDYLYPIQFFLAKSI